MQYHTTRCIRRIRQRTNQARASYRDRVDLDNNNRVFFIYSLGRYRNKPLYYFGETIDISSVEYALRKELPFYEQQIVVPVEDSVYGREEFEGFINRHQLEAKLPLEGSSFDSIFTSSESISFDNILDRVLDIYGCRKEQD